MHVQVVPARGSTSGLHVTHEDGRVETFAPYRRENIRQCIVIGSERVLLDVVGDKDCLVLYDIMRRTELRRLLLEAGTPKTLLLIAPDAVMVIDSVSVLIVDPRTLELKTVKRTMMIGPDGQAVLVEDRNPEADERWQTYKLRTIQANVGGDGRINLSWRDAPSGEWIGVAHLDPETLSGDAEIPRPPDEVPGALGRPGQDSPSGRYTLRRHYTTLPMLEPDKPAGEEGTLYGQSLDLWREEDGALSFERTLFIRWISIADIEVAFSGRVYRNVKNVNQVGMVVFKDLVEAARAGDMTFHLEARPKPRTYDDIEKNQQHLPTRMTSVLDMLHEIFATILWELDEQSFWVLSSATHKEGRGELRRVGLDGHLSARIRLERHGRPPFANLMTMRWQSDGQIELSSPLERMVVDPDLVAGRDPDDLVTLSMDADGFERTVPRPEDIEYVESGIALQPVFVGGWDSPSVIAAIEEMTNRIQTSYDDIMLGDDEFRLLSFSFALSEATIGEAEFFSGLVEREIRSAVPALRRLIAAFCAQRVTEGAALDEGDPDHLEAPLMDEDGTSALAHSLRTLLMLSPREVDLFRDYSTSRPRGGYDECEIFEELCQLHPLNDEASLRMAVIAVLSLLHKGGGPESWRRYRLLRSAPDVLKPREFAALLREEIEREEPDPVDRETYYYSGLLGMLETANETGMPQSHPIFHARTAQWLRGTARRGLSGWFRALFGW